jgi:voltage-gated sodium channel
MLQVIKHIYRFFLNDYNIVILVLINCLITFLLSFNNLILHKYLVIPDLILTFTFLFEMIVKLKVLRWRFFKKRINLFDLILVLLSVIPVFFSASMGQLSFLLVLRVVRVFKCARLFKAIPNYEHLFVNLKIAIRASGGVIIAIFIVIFVVSMILSSLYSSVVPEYFGTPFDSLYSVFRMFTIEGWYEIPDAIANNTSPVIGIITKYFLSVIVLAGGIFGMSFVTSTLTDEMAMDNNDEVLSKIKELNDKIDELNKKLRNTNIM